ncbi:Uncharacterized protein APZ42_017247 [Daphnia magna]|uniref:Uncharacterized protein n=1 Tax=Daphnia magna TaxID=35525 RepID=A0A164ZQK8_9CRUS|nr:Uncharacterized protein APZ42_017247 [Daphnia magna]
MHKFTNGSGMIGINSIKMVKAIVMLPSSKNSQDMNGWRLMSVM